MLLSDALKKRKTATSQPAASAPTTTLPSDADVTSFLHRMETDHAGMSEFVLLVPAKGTMKEEWVVTPSGALRDPHFFPIYGEDEDEDEEMSWEQDYAGPLEREVQAKLDKRFGKDLFDVYIDEEGQIRVSKK